VIGVQSIGSQRNAAREKLLLCENRASCRQRRFDTNRARWQVIWRPNRRQSPASATISGYKLSRPCLIR